MPQMDLIVKLFLVVLIGLLVGVIILYHIWLDHLIARERTQKQASAPAPERQPGKVDARAPEPDRAPRSA